MKTKCGSFRLVFTQKIDEIENRCHKPLRSKSDELNCEVELSSGSKSR